MERLQKSGSLWVAVLAVFGLGVSVAQATILPENDLWKQDGLFKSGGLNETEFNQAIDEVMAVYDPIIRSLGGVPQVMKLWSDSTVNARASRNGRTWKIEMFGGLARRPETTPDGMQLVVCHELGHHIAGFPFYKASIFGGMDWAATEGQSDYFATQECLRRVWDHQPSSTPIADVNPKVKAACDKSWTGRGDQEHCYRTAAAGLSVARLLGAIGSNPVVPEFDKTDTRVVTATNQAHPAAQCRLDTFFEGAVCKASFDVAKIPGRSHRNGQASVEAEREMANTSCTAFSSHTD
jgi:hypothetical protein